MGKGQLLGPDGLPAATPTALDLHAADTAKHGGGGGISSTLINAAGDIIVGSSTGTAARKGVGTNGQVLQVDTTLGDKLKWGDAAPLSNLVPAPHGPATPGTSTEAARALHSHGWPPPAHEVFVPGATMAAGDANAIPNAGGGTIAWGNGYLLVIPVRFSRAVPIKLGSLVVTAGGAGGLSRVGVWNDRLNADGYPTDDLPGTLAVDLGTVAVDVTGNRLAPTTFTPVLGRRYWIGKAFQHPTAAAPQERLAQPPPAVALPGWLSAPPGGAALRYDGRTGAFASLAATNPSDTVGQNDCLAFLVAL
ncbi:MAG: hypothetical protein M3404_05135 [Actinomycetota bacterium]|nr:hypothetical protein [Actinomycetota bacterium]